MQEFSKLVKNERGTYSYDLINSPTFRAIFTGFTRSFCNENTLGNLLCEMLVYSSCGENGSETDPTHLRIAINHLSGTVSIKQIDHFLQMTKYGDFRQFDYRENNTRVYNSSRPPRYKLKNVKAPVYLYSGECDDLVSERDVDDLQEALPNVRSRRTLKSYKHADFNNGRNSRTIFFEDVLKELLAEA